MVTGVIDYVADIGRWWSWELSSLVSRRRSVAAAGARPLLRVSRAGVSIETQRRPPEVVKPAEIGAALRRLPRRLRSPVVDVVVEPDRHLQRKLSPLRLPRSRMRAMARIDCAGATPLREEDCILVLPEYRRDHAASVYFLLRRDQFEPIRASLAAARIEIGRLAMATPDGVFVADAPSLAALRRPARMRRMAHRLFWGAVAASIFGLIALGGVTAWQQNRALDALGVEIAAAEAEASKVRADMRARTEEIGRIASVREAKSQAVPLVRILEELALALPDGTWLTRIDVDDGTVTLTGQTSGAARLIPLLEDSDLFRAPTFTQPVLRDAGSLDERFTITLETASADG